MFIRKSTHLAIVEEYKRAIQMKEQEIILLKDSLDDLQIELRNLAVSKPPEGKPVGGLRGWRNVKAEFNARQLAAIKRGNSAGTNDNNKSD